VGRLFPGADAVVLNVWEPIVSVAGRYPSGGMVAYAEDVDDTAFAEACQVTHEGARLAALAGLRARAQTVRMVADVAYTIDAAARDCNADIIVTGARGIGSIHELFSGSLSHHLIQNSKTPVLAIPTPEDAASATEAAG
jgi:nucleotide-binding universal stress UspA family protein